MTSVAAMCSASADKNHVHPIVFEEALQDLMINGRGKNWNIFIAGRTNCGKTFLIFPLQNISKTFNNPNNDKYAWLGAEKAGLIFVNDIRWSPEMIAWKDFCYFLRGLRLFICPLPRIIMNIILRLKPIHIYYCNGQIRNKIYHQIQFHWPRRRWNVSQMKAVQVPSSNFTGWAKGCHPILYMFLQVVLNGRTLNMN